MPRQQGAAELERPSLFCIGELVALLEVRLAVIMVVSVAMFTSGASMTSVAISASGASGAFEADISARLGPSSAISLIRRLH